MSNQEKSIAAYNKMIKAIESCETVLQLNCFIDVPKNFEFLFKDDVLANRMGSYLQQKLDDLDKHNNIDKLAFLLQDLQTKTMTFQEKYDLFFWAENNKDVSLDIFNKYLPSMLYVDDFSKETCLKGLSLKNLINENGELPNT
jgi:hypothetical protein